MISAPIIAYYYSQLIGDARNPPTLLATSEFNGIAVIGNASIISRRYQIKLTYLYLKMPIHTSQQGNST